MKEIALLSLVCMMSFYGCSTLKHSDDTAVKLTQVQIKEQAHSSDRIIEEGNWPTDTWWESFDDKQLTEFIQIAFEGSPNLQAAIARVESAKQEAKKTRSLFLPQFDASLYEDFQSYSRDGIFRYFFPEFPNNTTEIDLGLNLNYNLDLFGKERERYQAAISDAKAKQADLSMSRLMLASSVASVYFQMQSTYITLDLYKTLLDLQEEKADLAYSLWIRGINNKITFEEVEADLMTAKENVVAQEKQLILYQNQLKFLMGKSPGDELEIHEPHARFDRPFPLPKDLGLNLLARRPDIQAKLMTIESMAHLVKSSKAAFYPNINLSAAAGFNAISWPKLLRPENFLYTILPAIDLPLYLGGKLQAQLGEAKSNFSAAVFDYNQLVLEAAMQVSNYVAELTAYSKQQALQKNAIDSVATTSYLNNERHKRGIDNRTVAIDSEIMLVKAYLIDVSLQNKRHLTIVNLIQSLGGGYEAGVKKQEES